MRETRQSWGMLPMYGHLVWLTEGLPCFSRKKRRKKTTLVVRTTREKKTETRANGDRSQGGQILKTTKRELEREG